MKRAPGTTEFTMEQKVDVDAADTRIPEHRLWAAVLHQYIADVKHTIRTISKHMERFGYTTKSFDINLDCLIREPSTRRFKEICTYINIRPENFYIYAKNLEAETGVINRVIANEDFDLPELEVDPEESL